MNLLFVIEKQKYFDGANYSILKFVEHLSLKGHFITLYSNKKNPFGDKFSIPGNIEVIVRRSSPLNFLDTLFAIFQDEYYINYFRRNKFDYVVGYLNESAIKAVKIAKRIGIKCVNFIFESIPWVKKDLKERFSHDYEGKFEKIWKESRKAYLESDILLSNSKLSKQECEKWLSRKIDEFIYPGLDKKLINSTKIKEKENQIIYIGRLHIYKNVDIIIHALSNIKNSPKLMIIGDGDERENLKRLSKNLKVNIEIKSCANDYEKFIEIKKSIFMIFPSSHEGFGMPPMEALCCGIPCICSDKDIFKEIYGDKVEYFKELDVNNLKEKIEFLINNPAYCYLKGEEGKMYVCEKFSWEESVEKIEKVLSS